MPPAKQAKLMQNANNNVITDTAEFDEAVREQDVSLVQNERLIQTESLLSKT